MKKKRKLTRAQKDRANARARERRERTSQQRYKEYIETINLKLQDYFDYFGNAGYDYNNLAISIEKIFMKNFDFIVENGTTTKAMSINPVASTIKDNKKNLRTTITRAYKFMNEVEQASVIAEDVYDTKSKEIAKLKATIRKLEEDVSPNYYEALGTISMRESMKFRSAFSEKLKGKKKDSDEFRESYEELGSQIINFLNSKAEQEEKLLKSVKNERYGKPKTLKELIEKMKK